MAIESIHEIRQAFNVPELPVSVFRRNLIVSQTNLAALVGRQFAIQDVQFEGVQECSPCRWMDQMVGKGAKAFMQHHFRGGLRAKILTDGVLSVRRGDER